MISPVFVPGCSRPLFCRRAVTSHSSGRRSLPRPFRPFARSLPPTIPPPVPLSVWPRSAAFASYPASASNLAGDRGRACPVWWQALAPRSRGHLHITFFEIVAAASARSRGVEPRPAVRCGSNRSRGAVEPRPPVWAAPVVCRVVFGTGAALEIARHFARL